MNKRQLEVLKQELQYEKGMVEELTEIFGLAAKDCENKIAYLSARKDLENINSIIYQKKYQEIIKKQLDDALKTLQDKSYDSIKDYIEQSYESGFLGSLYDIQGQGVPLIFPIDQEQMAKALYVDSKISNGLYTRMGENVDNLKRSIRMELSRGIATGSTWNQMAAVIAHGMNTPYKKAINNSIRIARTEGHRIQAEASLHCMGKAKAKGADIVKIWDSTLDGKTRPTHRLLDGQIKEIEEPFEVSGLKAMYPGGFGIAAEDVNCRCRVLQEARWALGDAFTKRDQETDQLVKIEANDYENFKEEYYSNLGNAATEMSQATKITEKKHSVEYGTVNRDLINSKAYHDKFSQLTSKKNVDEAIYRESTKILEHRDGTPYEDLSIISGRTGKLISSVTDYDEFGKLSITRNVYNKIVNSKEKVILVHNHPNNSRVSYKDILLLKNENIDSVIAVGHDGSVKMVSDLKKNIDIEIFWEKTYNEYKHKYMNSVQASIFATDDLYKAKLFRSIER